MVTDFASTGACESFITWSGSPGLWQQFRGDMLSLAHRAQFLMPIHLNCAGVVAEGRILSQVISRSLSDVSFE